MACGAGSKELPVSLVAIKGCWVWLDGQLGEEEE